MRGEARCSGGVEGGSLFVVVTVVVLVGDVGDDNGVTVVEES